MVKPRPCVVPEVRTSRACSPAGRRVPYGTMSRHASLLKKLGAASEQAHVAPREGGASEPTPDPPPGMVLHLLGGVRPPPPDGAACRGGGQTPPPP